MFSHFACNILHIKSVVTLLISMFLESLKAYGSLRHWDSISVSFGMRLGNRFTTTASDGILVVSGHLGIYKLKGLQKRIIVRESLERLCRCGNVET